MFTCVIKIIGIIYSVMGLKVSPKPYSTYSVMSNFMVRQTGLKLAYQSSS